MSLLFMDSFDHYATADLGTKYEHANGTIGTSTGRRSSGGLAIAGERVYKAISPDASGIVTIGVACKPSQYDDGVVVALYGSNANAQIGVKLNASGGFDCYRPGWPGDWHWPWGGIKTLLGSTRTGVIAALNVWYYIEVQMRVHDTDGLVKIHVNGINEAFTPDLSAGQDTKYDADLVAGGFAGVFGSGYIDDLYILDSSGSINNDFLSDMRVDAHFPVTPDGTNHAWTPSTGSDNFAVVDEPAPNTSDYNSTVTAAAIDTFNMEQFKNSGGIIKGVQLNLFHSKEDAGSCLVAPVMRTHATEYVGSDFAPAESAYKYATPMYEMNPFTEVAWLESDFNVVEPGYKKTG